MSKADLAFPESERALMPLLSGEDDNAVFQAFRRRRVVHSRRFRLPTLRVQFDSIFVRFLVLGVMLAATLVLFRIAVGISYSLISVLIPAAQSSGFVILSSFVSGCVLTLLCLGLSIAGYFVLLRLLARRRETKRVLPRWCGEVFTSRGILHGIAMDLWLSGARGSHIAEAIVLEAMEGKRGSARVQWFVIVAVALAFYAWQADLYRMSTHLLGGAAVVFTWQGRDLFWWGKLNMARGTRLKALLQGWQAYGKSVTVAARGGALTALGYAGLLMGGLLGFAGLMVGAIYLIGFLSRMRLSWIPFEDWEVIPLCGAIVFVCLAIPARQLTRRLLQRECRLLARDLKGADAAFESAMRIGNG